MLMPNFGVTNKEYYGMLWYFWSGQFGMCWAILDSKSQNGSRWYHYWAHLISELATVKAALALPLNFALLIAK